MLACVCIQNNCYLTFNRIHTDANTHTHIRIGTVFKCLVCNNIRRADAVCVRMYERVETAFICVCNTAKCCKKCINRAHRETEKRERDGKELNNGKERSTHKKKKVAFNKNRISVCSGKSNSESETETERN